MLHTTELGATYAARTSGVYSRYEVKDETLCPNEIIKHAITNVSVLVQRGFSLDEIADLVDTRTNHPNAVAALGYVFMHYIISGGEPLRKSRRIVKTCQFTTNVIERLAIRCDILWNKL